MKNTDNEIDSERVSPDIDIESLSDSHKASASPSSVQKQRNRDRKPRTKKSFKEEQPEDDGYN